MGFKVLADKRIKFTVLTDEPANPASPTAAELNAVSAIDGSCKVFFDDFKWTAAASERLAERMLCEGSETSVPGVGNYDLGFTVARFFAEAGGFDATDDLLFEAVKVKGTNLWGYVRRTDKLYTEAWESGDEFQLGGAFVTDTPQARDGGGSHAYRVDVTAGEMHDFGTVGGI